LLLQLCFPRKEAGQAELVEMPRVGRPVFCPRESAKIDSHTHKPKDVAAIRSGSCVDEDAAGGPV